MNLRLYSHVNADGDLLNAWFRHYRRLGVTSFHLIVHGSRTENSRLHELTGQHPVIVEDSYEGEFDVREKQRRLNRLLMRDAGQWVVIADSDEFIELPFGSFATTVRVLQWADVNVLYAPMLQHLAAEGSLETPLEIDDPFLLQPRCSVELYRQMGSSADTNKYPLFHNTVGTQLTDGGNHNPPLGCDRHAGSIRGVTHHFKFRSCVLERLGRRIDSTHPFRGESVLFRDYLARHDWRVPIAGSFDYSRAELFRRGLLQRPGIAAAWRHVFGRTSAPPAGT